MKVSWLAVVLSVAVPMSSQSVAAADATKSPAASASSTAIYPGAHWGRASNPQQHGLSATRLASITPFLQSLDTSAMMVVVDGVSVYEYGDLAAISYLASCRKSVLAILFGKYVASGRVQPEQRLREIEFDDIGGLLPSELDATIDHLMTSRSGVVHPAAYTGDAMAFAPPRGSQKAGHYYIYNNWDFNALGSIFEQLTGQGIYAALSRDLAIPLGMEDFELARQAKSGDASLSKHLGYPMDLSTRDMARIGYLMLREGNWHGRQIVPKEWVRRITTLVTPVDSINPPSWKGIAEGSHWGYGRMWWVWDDRGLEGPFAGAYTGWGSTGQFITVLPALNMVIAHKTIPGETADGRERNVSVMQYQALLMHLVAAHDRGAMETRQ